MRNDAGVGLSPIAEIMETRQGTYGFLAQAFLQEISEEFFRRMISQEGVSALVRVSSQEGSEFARGIVLIQEAMHELATKVEAKEMISTLRREFAHIFIVKGAGAVCPYESVYRGQERLLMQEPYDQVKKAYREAGVIRSDEGAEIEDHVGVELEFMGLLCQEAVEACCAGNGEALRRSLRLQQRFISEHLARWIPALCEDILKRTRMDFYKGIAYATRGFVTIEQAELEYLMSLALNQGK